MTIFQRIVYTVFRIGTMCLCFTMYAAAAAFGLWFVFDWRYGYMWWFSVSECGVFILVIAMIIAATGRKLWLRRRKVAV